MLVHHGFRNCVFVDRCRHKFGFVAMILGHFSSVCHGVKILRYLFPNFNGWERLHPTIYNGCHYLSVKGATGHNAANTKQNKTKWMSDATRWMINIVNILLIVRTYYITSVIAKSDIYLIYRYLLTSPNTLQWRHNGHDNVSNHQPHDCSLNRLFRPRSKKTSKLPVTVLCVGNSPGTDEFPAQMASNAENVSIWWRHHDMTTYSHNGSHFTPQLVF